VDHRRLIENFGKLHTVAQNALKFALDALGKGDRDRGIKWLKVFESSF
jgi:hypothetical protein